MATKNFSLDEKHIEYIHTTATKMGISDSAFLQRLLDYVMGKEGEEKNIIEKIFDKLKIGF